MLGPSLPASVFAPVLLVALAVPPPGVPAYVVNGSFEPISGAFAIPRDVGVIPGWRASAAGVDWLPAAAEGASAPNGSWIVRLEGGERAALAQQLTTIPGQRYVVTFWLGGRGVSGAARVRVEAGDAARVVNTANAADELLWQPQTFAFTARAVATTLAFRAAHGGDAYLDAVAVRAAGE